MTDISQIARGHLAGSHFSGSSRTCTHTPVWHLGTEWNMGNVTTATKQKVSNVECCKKNNK